MIKIYFVWSFVWFHVTSQVALVLKNPPASSGDTEMQVESLGL